MLDLANPVHVQLFLAEMLRRSDQMAADESAHIDFADYSFALQAKAIHSKASKLAVFCPRRSGKSQTLARRLAQRAEDNPDSPCLYVGLSQKSCKRIFWDDAWKKLKRQYPISGKTYRDGVHEFANGSVLYSLGMDADEEQMGKLLGGQYAEIAIDEAQKFRVNVENLVYEVLEPATLDLGGSIGLYGTPDDYLEGLFYKVTRTDGIERRSGWEVHEWTPFDNPYMVNQWTKQLADIKRFRPEFMLTPAFQRMYLGKWVVDDSKRVYKTSKERNWAPALPEPGRGKRFGYILGVDIGFNDECAFTILCYLSGQRNVYVVEVAKEAGLLIGGIRTRIEFYLKKYGAEFAVIDGANKTVVETLRDSYGLPLITADKVGKQDFIALMNSEYASGNIKHIGDGARLLEEEQEKLIWLVKGTKKEEHPNLPNHACDATLYGWRYIYSYLYDEPAAKDDQRSEEDKIEERLERQMKQKQSEFDIFSEPMHEPLATDRYDPWSEFDDYGQFRGF